VWEWGSVGVGREYTTRGQIKLVRGPPLGYNPVQFRSRGGRILPIVLIIALVVLLALLGGVGWLFYRMYKRKSTWGVAIMAGLFIGPMVWLAYVVWPPSTAASVVLVVLAVAGALTLLRLDREMFKKSLIVAAVSVVALLLIWQVGLISWLNAEVVSDIEVLNPEGTGGTALVVYHPGKSDFQRRANRAFAEGLASNGWRVEITTASREAPTDLSGYDLLVLGAPTYDWYPARRIERYVSSLGDLGGQPTVVIVSGMGSTQLSVPRMEGLVREANGELVKSLALWTAAPNEEVYGIDDPVEIMKREAATISPPGAD
jgi:hypothetical protein